jgi:hypothetical protein
MQKVNGAGLALSWVSWPLREEPQSAWIVAAFTLLTGGGLLAYTHNWGWAAGGAALLLLTVRAWFLPTRFTLDAQGATRRCLGVERRMPWTRVRRASPDRRGVLLSPLPYPSRLETFRGLYLRFAENREAVMAFVQEKAGK